MMGRRGRSSAFASKSRASSATTALLVAVAVPGGAFGWRHLPDRVSPAARYHEGHQPELVVRLHRLEGAGEAAMLEAEARWQRRGELELEHGYDGVTMSSEQLRALREYHQRALVEVSASIFGMNQSASGHRHRVTMHAAQASLGEALPVTPLERMSSQYVGPVAVGTVALPSGCERQAKAESLIFIPSSAAETQSCHVSEQAHVLAVYDTGSTNIWIASDLCKAGPCASPGRARYDHTQSMTYSEPPSDVKLRIRFGTGEVSGPQALDDFHIGPFTVYKQTFGLIQEEEGTVFQQVPFEGIVGLAFPQMSANGVTPFFDNIIKQKVLKKNEFSFYFSRSDPSANAILWGGVDKKLHDGDIEFFPVVEPWYWSLKLKSFKIGSEEFLEAKPGSLLSLGATRSAVRAGAGYKVIVDTGTTYFTADSVLFPRVMQRLPSGLCSALTRESHPDMTYTLENVAGESRDFVLTNEHYMVRDRGENPTCSPAFMEITVPSQHGPAMIWGEVFLRQYFTVFDRADGSSSAARVGFAKARHGKDVDLHLQELTKQQATFGASLKKQ